MPDEFPLLPTELNRQVVLAKCEYFVNVHLWPLHVDLNSELWLENFTNDEIDHAVHLLNSFIYFSDPLIKQMFMSAFQGLSKYIWQRGDSFLPAQAAWRSFVDRVIITYVTGENPSEADSGHVFARKARQVLGINDERILSPENALRELLRHGTTPVVFVDDFVGSGEQFINTWQRTVDVPESKGISFEMVSETRGGQFYYSPLVVTQGGHETLQSVCPEVKLSPAHILSPRYNALAEDSILWPSHLQSTAFEFLKSASARAGIPDTDGTSPDDWQGFHKMGLAIAFEHSVPDATLPIFRWEENGWNPLKRKT